METVAQRIRLGRYRHFKGMLYEVLSVTKRSEHSEELVVYRALHGNQQLWVRPANMFLADRARRAARAMAGYDA